ncbi:hypothetical protein IIA79_00520 [bacterium]|nr:hypothetical protein [bacterium]
MLIYCDETYTSDAELFAIGGLWLPKDLLPDVIARITSVRNTHNYYREMKWHKVGTGKFAMYCDLADVFFHYGDELAFNCIVVRKAEVDYKRFHAGDEQLGFRKFYYLLLSRRLRTDAQYLIRLDQHPAISGAELDTIRDCCTYFFWQEQGEDKPDPIQNLESYNSERADIGQLADFLLGAVGAAWNKLCTNPAKLQAQAHIAQKLGYYSLTISTQPSEPKFNIWRWKASAR